MPTALVVDDNRQNADGLAQIIEMLGLKAEVAYGARTGMMMILKRTPDVIFLDINMPIVDGFVFLYEFEKFNSYLRNKCKVIILSSSDNKRDIDKIVNNDNVVKFITKPLTENALDEIKTL